MLTLHPAERRDRDPHGSLLIDLRDHQLAVAVVDHRNRRHVGLSVQEVNRVLTDMGKHADRWLRVFHATVRNGRAA